MELLYISASCSKKKNEELYSIQHTHVLQPQQKFHNQLITGLSKVDGINVICLSAYPLSASTCDVKYFPAEDEIVSDSLKYHYIPLNNGRLTRYTSLLKNSRRFIEEWEQLTRGKERVVIADVINIFLTLNCFNFLKKERIPLLGIITDVPTLCTKMKQRHEGFFKNLFTQLIEHITELSLTRYNAYIPVTKTINDRLNKTAKPYIVIEGSVDNTLFYNRVSSQKPRVVMYAGGVYEKYGLKLLVDAFDRLQTDAELHIYGNGTYVDSVREKCKTNPRIQYKGVVSVDKIFQLERNATLLVNVRPSDEDFSIYSFPSKVHEYMSTGTPALLTKLKGIPEVYYKYCFTVNKEDCDGVYAALKDVLSRSDEELTRVGREAFDFVSKEKNNLEQGRRIISFIRGLNI